MVFNKKGSLIAIGIIVLLLLCYFVLKKKQGSLSGLSNYDKMMRWNKKHRKGIKQVYCGFDCHSKFTPSQNWMQKKWFPYLEKCKKEGINPMDCEQYYYSSL